MSPALDRKLDRHRADGTGRAENQDGVSRPHAEGVDTRIVANLWTKPEYRDIALRDIGLALGALALARMAADVPRERSVAELPA